jgi:sulfonate dioxygenase
LERLTLCRNIRAHNNFGGEYHADHSFELNPPSYTLLRMVKTPPSGGDTIFTSQTALFDKLSPTFQKTFESLHAIHSSDVSK